ncbi:MAG TPA: nuclear transport factor 2 family protein [Gemmatimonadales bacterium]
MAGLQEGIAAPPTPDEMALARVNAEYVQAFLHADADWYREHLADDFVCIEVNGSVLDKEQFLRRAAEGPSLTDYRLEAVAIRIYGEVALVHGQGWIRRHDATTGESRYTTIYRKIGGEWKAIAAQVTRKLSRKESLL